MKVSDFNKEDAFRLAVENAIMDGIAKARLAEPRSIPVDAEYAAVRSLRIDGQI